MNFISIQSNQMHAPPSYKDLGIAKPKKEISEANLDRPEYDHRKLPYKHITYSVCKKGEGILVRINQNEYEHENCHRDLV